jgi:hypothetical protein
MPPTDYEALHRKKVAAGLSHADAKEVVERQKAHDARVAKLSAPAAEPEAPAADDGESTAKGKKGAKGAS